MVGAVVASEVDENCGVAREPFPELRIGFRYGLCREEDGPAAYGCVWDDVVGEVDFRQ
jgi:hypothetical protein